MPLGNATISDCFRQQKQPFIQTHGASQIVLIKAFKNATKRQIFLKNQAKIDPFTLKERQHNGIIARERVVNENVIGMMKRFKIIADRYRNRRKRFALRFNLIAAIYNLELDS